MTSRRTPLSTAGKATVAVLVVLSLALAGCVGSSGPAEPQDQDPAADGDDGSGSGGADGDGSGGDGDDGSGSGNGAGGNGAGSDGDDDGDDGDADAPPRTPSDAMDGEPADSGEGWARFEMSGTASPTVRVIFDFFSDRYNHPLHLAADVTLIEGVLRWESEYADLDLCIEDGAGQTRECSDHGMPAKEAFNTLPTSSVNGTMCEHLIFDQQDIDTVEPPDDMGVYVREGEVWEPTSVPGEADESMGMPWTLTVWVYTVPGQEPEHAPWDDEACGA